MTLHIFQIEIRWELVRQSLQINCYEGNGKFLRQSQKYFHVQINYFYLEVDIVPEHLTFYAIFIHGHPITGFPRKTTLNTWG